jgi:AcrR family transcriptional regulator
MFRCGICARTTVAGSDTKRRILESGVEQFGAQGYRGTRLRELIEAAGVNQAAVNYHFGSKEGLYRAILQEYAELLARRRLELLDDVLAGSGDGRPEVEDVLRALIQPFFELRDSPGGEVVGRFFEQFIAERTPFIQELYREALKPTADRFLAALELALPEVPRDELCRAYAWTAHLMTHGSGDVVYQVLANSSAPSSLEAVLDFCVGGFERLERRY